MLCSAVDMWSAGKEAIWRTTEVRRRGAVASMDVNQRLYISWAESR